MRNKQDLFRKLPFEIVKEIMLRLPVGSIPICKRVCKAWLHLLSSHEFLNSYISKLGPLKAVMTEGSNSTWCRVFVSKEVKEFQLDPLIAYEYDEEYDSELEWGSSETESSETGSDSDSFSGSKSDAPLISFEFPPGLVLRIEDSVNGLLFLRDRSYERNNIYVCNPMTRELCRLELPPSTIGTLERPPEINCGFGASRITGQHKVVAFHRSEPFCYVYTIGTRPVWRRIEALPGRISYNMEFGLFINGNIYWVDTDTNVICCFDVETECFSSLHLPPSYIVYFSCEIDQDREFRVIKVYEEQDGFMVIYYPDETTTDTELIDILYARCYDHFNRIEKNSMLLPPSFVSLKTPDMENVISF
ncbi:hypothetical protein OROHE_005405 [Orobanche hederae]